RGGLGGGRAGEGEEEEWGEEAGCAHRRRRSSGTAASTRGLVGKMRAAAEATAPRAASPPFFMPPAPAFSCQPSAAHAVLDDLVLVAVRGEDLVAVVDGEAEDDGAAAEGVEEVAVAVEDADAVAEVADVDAPAP